MWSYPVDLVAINFTFGSALSASASRREWMNGDNISHFSGDCSNRTSKTSGNKSALGPKRSRRNFSSAALVSKKTCFITSRTNCHTLRGTIASFRQNDDSVTNQRQQILQQKA